MRDICRWHVEEFRVSDLKAGIRTRRRWQPVRSHQAPSSGTDSSFEIRYANSSTCQRQMSRMTRWPSLHRRLKSCLQRACNRVPRGSVAQPREARGCSGTWSACRMRRGFGAWPAPGRADRSAVGDAGPVLHIAIEIGWSDLFIAWRQASDWRVRDREYRRDVRLRGLCHSVGSFFCRADASASTVSRMLFLR